MAHPSRRANTGTHRRVRVPCRLPETRRGHINEALATAPTRGREDRLDIARLTRVSYIHDVIGSYETELDATGALRGYRRVRRYARCQTHPVHEFEADDQERIEHRDADADR